MPKIKKKYQKGFTTLDNAVINDESLSWKAKGLFVYLWSRPDNWSYRVSEVAKHSKDGLGSTSSGVNELEKAGYLKRQQKNEHGVFGDTVWTLSDEPIFKKPTTKNPITDNPITEKPCTDYPSTENCKLLNTDIPNTDKQNTDLTKIHSPADPDKYAAERKKIVGYLNERLGTSYRPNAKKAKTHIDARLKEDYEFDDFKQVIDNKISDWLHDPHMSQYLRPETLFGPKFEGYLNEKRAPAPLTTYEERDGHFG